MVDPAESTGRAPSAVSRHHRAIPRWAAWGIVIIVVYLFVGSTEKVQTIDVARTYLVDECPQSEPMCPFTLLVVVDADGTQFVTDGADQEWAASAFHIGPNTVTVHEPLIRSLLPAWVPLLDRIAPSSVSAP